MADYVWQPDARWLTDSRIARFIAACGVADLDELQARAASDPAWFWEQAVKDIGIEWYEPPQQILDLTAGVPWATWFRGARMNLAHEAVDKHLRTRPHQLAVVYEGEEGTVRTWSYRQLWAESNRLAGGLRALGVGRGDRVGIMLPLVPEAVAATMALARLGAIFTPIFSGFAPGAAASRLADCEAKMLITADGFYRRGRLVNLKAVADQAVAQAPSVRQVLVVRRTGAAVDWTAGRDLWYDDVVAGQPARFETERLDPEDPCMIIYTSGTTGRPKGAVHVHGGFPVKAAQDMAHCFDVGPGDLVMWFTDLGWMMGPWLIYGALFLGATAYLYDGAPDYPGPDRLWAMVERHGITHLGLSPTVIRALAPAGTEWVARHDLSSLRVLGGTGEPWNPEPYRWFVERVGGGRCPMINYSGGTEISGGILGCVPIRPLKACSFNTVVPGMAAALLDEQGQPVPPGQVGELALTAPWVGMTRGFWRDPQRYLEAYWNRFPGVWVHGDFASMDEEGFWYIHGRSDDTIKVAGKRVGPAEYESALVSHPQVQEAATVGVPHPVKGEAAVCFVVLRPGAEPSGALAGELRDLLAREMGRPLLPEAILFVGALPKTRNAKIMRRVIRAAYLGGDPGDLSALENPEAVAEIRRVSGQAQEG